MIDVGATLRAMRLEARGDGNGPFAGLPQYGVADLWGKSFGYDHVWDVIEETRRLGVSRRISGVPSLTPPYPVLMMHVEGFVSVPTGDWQFVDRYFDVAEIDTRPWRDAESLGRVGDDSYLLHPHTEFYKFVSDMDRDDTLDDFMEYTRTEFHQGVFGLSWITDIVYVLGRNDTEVPEKYADRGVVAAVTQDDPRAEDVDESGHAGR